jgi:serine/threonine protein kinase
VVKVYDSRFSRQAEQEYRNMKMLQTLMEDRAKVVQVFNLGTVNCINEEEEIEEVEVRQNAVRNNRRTFQVSPEVVMAMEGAGKNREGNAEHQ